VIFEDFDGPAQWSNMAAQMTRALPDAANHNNHIAEYWESSAEGLFNPDRVNNAYRLGVSYIVYGMTH